MTTTPWLVVKTGGMERFIDRSQIVQITFHTQPPQIRDSRGGQYDAETEEERANPDIPEQFVAEIYTTGSGEPVRVVDDEARRLRQTLGYEAGTDPGSHR